MKFVEDSVVESMQAGRRNNKEWTDFIEELYQHPNRWAEYPVAVVSPSGIYRYAKKYADIEIRTTGGNLLPKHHPDKRLWTVYVRFSPKPGPKNKTTKLLNKEKNG